MNSPLYQITRLLILISIPVVSLAQTDLPSSANSLYELTDPVDLQLQGENRSFDDNNLNSIKNQPPSIMDGEMTKEEITQYLTSILGIAPAFMIEKEDGDDLKAYAEALSLCQTDYQVHYYMKLLDQLRMKLDSDIHSSHALFISDRYEPYPNSLLGMGYDYIYTELFVKVPDWTYENYILHFEFHFNEEKPAQLNAHELYDIFFGTYIIKDQIIVPNDCRIRAKVILNPNFQTYRTLYTHNKMSFTIMVQVDYERPEEPLALVVRDEAERKLAAKIRGAFEQ